MNVQNLEILEIRAIKVDSKARKATLKIILSDNTTLNKDVSLNEDYQKLTASLIKWIKTEKKQQDDDDDPILGGISLVNIRNDEDILDVAPKGFIRLDQKLGNTRGIKNATDYMRAYGQLLTLQEVIYKGKKSS